MLREFIRISLENLWRLKLRSVLTIAGIMIGIGALVSMFSFGFGVQKNVTAEFDKLGLFRTLQVTPGERKDPADSTKVVPIPLDEAGLARIAGLNGVAMAYPQVSFKARVEGLGTDLQARVQAVPASFFDRRPFGQLVAGRVFASDSTHEAVVSRNWLVRNKVSPDSALGRTVRLRTAGANEILLGVGQRYLTSLGLPGPWADAALMGARVVLDRLRPGDRSATIVGVADIESGFGFFQGELLVPSGIVDQLDFLSFNDPMDLVGLLARPTASGWSMIVVTLTSERDYVSVRREIEALGFKLFSFNEQFDELRRSFLLFDAFIGVLGLIALVVAGLGIVNTMVMSITERTREIGILKSLGAREEQIRFLFLVESGAIGLIGSLAGIVLGLAVSRAASAISRQWMIRQQVPTVELFYLPPWVYPAAIAFGILLAVLAGLYPAARAAAVDPVEALRHD